MSGGGARTPASVEFTKFPKLIWYPSSLLFSSSVSSTQFRNRIGSIPRLMSGSISISCGSGGAGAGAGFLGNSGIKFEVEGGEGSAGADTYIPLHRKIAFFQLFSETFRKMLYFGEIPKKIGQNWARFSKIQQKSGKFCKILLKKSAKLSAFSTKKLRLENGAKECIV